MTIPPLDDLEVVVAWARLAASTAVGVFAVVWWGRKIEDALETFVMETGKRVIP